jgi:hypothetical protein
LSAVFEAVSAALAVLSAISLALAASFQSFSLARHKKKLNTAMKKVAPAVIASHKLLLEEDSL